MVEGTAQLRMLLVEPTARGLGIGARLVDECERFARARGYRRIVLWTNSVLGAARAIYKRAGYVLTGSEPHESFGHKLVGETWELALGSRRQPAHKPGHSRMMPAARRCKMVLPAGCRRPRIDDRDEPLP